MQGRGAIDVALSVYRQPVLVKSTREMKLPLEILSVLRIAAGEEVDPSLISPDRARSVEEAKAAAAFFIQQILLHPYADNHRILGLSSISTIGQLKEHKRWMLKWLHPDRNHNKWESALFQRVIKAADELETQLTKNVATIGGGVVQPQNNERRRRIQMAKTSVHRFTPTEKSGSCLMQYSLRIVALLAILFLSGVIWTRFANSQVTSASTDMSVSWLSW